MKEIRKIFIVLVLLLSLCLVGCKKDKDDNIEHTHQFELFSTNQRPTCTKDGENLLICRECEEIKTEVIPATGHNPIPATCKEPSVCSVCSEVLSTDLLEHTYTNWSIVKEATCKEDGTKERECIVCHTKEQELILKLEHNFEFIEIVKEASCEKNGEEKYKCSLCEEEKTEVIKAIGHKSEPATCTSYEKCLECGKVLGTEMLEHNYTEWNVIKESSCIEKGLKERECTECHKKETESIDMIDHQYEIVDGSEVCSVCKYEKGLAELTTKIQNINLVVDGENGLVLPTEFEGYALTWKSNTPDIVLDDGTIYTKNVIQYAQMIAKFVYNEQEVETIVDVKIPLIDTARIEYCWSAYYSLKIPFETTTNIRFLKKTYGGVCSVVRYETSDENIITTGGTITQQTYDQEAVVTCYLQIGKLIQSFSRTVKVLAFSDLQCIDNVIDWIPSVLEQLSKGEINKLPLTHERFGTNISWFCMDSGIIAGEGVFVMPLTPQNITLEATIIMGEYDRTLTYQLENIGGGVTEIERLRQWMKGQLPSRIRGTKNYVLESDAFDYQIRTNYGGVLNLIDGSFPEVDKSLYIDHTKNTWVNRYFGSGTLGTMTHPELTQDVLDKMMYTGYKKPNEQNILWIVVHESGMPRAGNDAELLAQIQMDSANGLRNREASWNYQVDENKIYQSFDDSIICWHASDGTRTPGGGNNNGIGIEMCINEDGNYDGAMHLDAKLIAMLLTKYNLKLENVKRHFDFAPDKKQCPYYMIEVGRWNEFLNLVDKEYTAMSLLKDAKVSWSVTTDDCNNTEEVLNKYFTKGGSTLYYNLPVKEEVVLHVTMTVEYEGQTLSESNDLVLYPNGK